MYACQYSTCSQKRNSGWARLYSDSPHPQQEAVRIHGGCKNHFSEIAWIEPPPFEAFQNKRLFAFFGIYRKGNPCSLWKTWLICEYVSQMTPFGHFEKHSRLCVGLHFVWLGTREPQPRRNFHLSRWKRLSTFLPSIWLPTRSSSSPRLVRVTVQWSSWRTGLLKDYKKMWKRKLLLARTTARMALFNDMCIKDVSILALETAVFF